METKQEIGTHRVQQGHYFYIKDGSNDKIANVLVWSRHNVLYVTDLWVHHEHRHKGFGTRLLKHVIDKFGWNDLFLSVSAYTNQPLTDINLARWYQKFGFENIPEAPGMMKRTGIVPWMVCRAYAELLHEQYEELAPDFNYETREDTRQFDPESKNGRLMIATMNIFLKDVADHLQNRSLGG